MNAAEEKVRQLDNRPEEIPQERGIGKKRGWIYNRY